MKDLLTSFYSKQSVNLQLNASIILWLTMAVFWPKKSLVYYIKLGTAPLTFLAVFVIALTISAYLSLIFGLGEISSDGPRPEDNHIDLPNRQTTHFGFSHFSGPLVQTVLLLLPWIPILLISAGISGMTIQGSFMAVSILFTTSLVCCFFGLLVYQVFQERRFLSFLITRSFFVCLLVATGFLGPHVNPLLILYGINSGKEMLVGPSISSYMFYMAITIFAAGLLTFANRVIMRYHR